MTDPQRCSTCDKLPPLAFLAPTVHCRVAEFVLEADDHGNHITVHAAQTYSRKGLTDNPAALNVEQAQRLRDWLTTWLDRQ
jgi:hypothetical protein